MSLIDKVSVPGSATLACARAAIARMRGRPLQVMTFDQLDAMLALAAATERFVAFYDIFQGEARDGFRGFIRDNAHEEAEAALAEMRGQLANLAELGGDAEEVNDGR